jgi:hypothetical protein
MRDTDSGPVLDTLVVRDTWTGASVTLRGATATLEAMASESGESITGLWAAAHYIAADQARQLGRRPGATVTLAEVERARLRLAEQGIRPSRGALATETPCSPESVLRAVKRDGYQSVAQWVRARESSAF